MKRIVPYVLFCLSLLIGWQGHAQQVGRYSMYMQNFYSMNAAAAGLEDHVDATLAYRKQWLGFENAPTNYFASANMPIKRSYQSPANQSLRVSNPGMYEKELPVQRRSKHGVGVMTSVNQFGAFKFTQIYGTYAFHLPLSRRVNLSFGANVGLNAFSIDQNLIQLELPEDPFYSQVIADAQQNSSMLDIDVAFLLYSKMFFVGYSTEQLVGNRLAFSGKSNFGDLQVNHRILFGKTFRVNRDVRLIPNGFVVLSATGLVSAEVNTRLDYRDQLWCGLSYRHKDAVIPMAGVYINNQIKIGYAYDYNISAMRIYGLGGSHEVMLGVMIGGNKRVVF